VEEDQVLADLLAELSEENKTNNPSKPEFLGEEDHYNKTIVTKSSKVLAAKNKLKKIKSPAIEKNEPIETNAEIIKMKPARVQSNTTTQSYNNPNLINDIQEIFLNTTHELIKNSRLDRAELQETIDHIKNSVMGENKVSASMTTSLVEAHGIKANINTNMIKILDSMSRFTTANKSGTISKNITIENEELSKLLDG